jgi:hypothetical protein
MLESGMDIMAHVGDVDPEDVLLFALLDGDSVVEVLGVGGVCGPGGQVPEVLPYRYFVLNLLLDVLDAALGLAHDGAGELIAEFELREQLLALLLERVGECLRDANGALPFGSAGLGLGVLGFGHTLELEEPIGRRFGVSRRRRLLSGVLVGSLGGRT